LPLLEHYYAVLRERGGESFDVREAARIELDWWQLRREQSTPAQYGAVIARASQVVFNTDNAELRQAGLMRAEMMAFRDEHRHGTLQAADWAHIETALVRSYTALHAGIARH